MKGDFEVRVISNRSIARGIYEIWLALPEAADRVAPLPGQFVNLRVDGFFLRRPVSVAGFDERNSQIRIIVRDVGGGTKKISRIVPGDALKALLPLGNPFPDIAKGTVYLVSGGVGAAPLLFAAEFLTKKTHGDITIKTFAGFADEDSAFGADEFAKYGQIQTSIGGLVTDLLARSLETGSPDAIFACGPTPMLATLQKMTSGRRARTFASFEARMGCGLGACLACGLQSRSGDGDLSYKRVCRDGPVFELSEAGIL
jgi:dihydroorotate dehydrogenase electron transfer subunit